jgi:hypothetical protein
MEPKVIKNSAGLVAISSTPEEKSYFVAALTQFQGRPVIDPRKPVKEQKADSASQQRATNALAKFDASGNDSELIISSEEFATLLDACKTYEK